MTTLIYLNVKDQQGSNLQFRIEKSTLLGELMDVYCSRLGSQPSQVCFMVDGKHILPDETAEKLGLQTKAFLQSR